MEAFNPPECKGWSRGRIIRNVLGETKEFVYVKTWNTPVNNDIDGAPAP